MRKALAVFILFSILSIGYSASLSRPGVPSSLDQDLASTGHEGDQSVANLAFKQNVGGTGYVEAAQRPESKITIVFAGLIYLRHKGGPKKNGPFTACILKNIPGHTFQLLLGDISIKHTAKEKKWDLKVLKGSSDSPKGGAHPYWKDGFGRKKKEHPCDDYQWIADFDELYPDGYDVDDDGLNPVVRIPAGKFYTLCRTVRLTHKKGDVDKGEFGLMADIVGADIILEPGEKLVLRSGPTDIIDPLEYQEGTRYIIFANLPPTNLSPGHHSGHPRIGELQSNPPTHFLNYYFAIRKKYEDRYDFHLKEAPEYCILPQDLTDLLKAKVSLSPPPYYCGVGGGGG